MIPEGTSGDIDFDVVICEVPHKDLEWHMTVNNFRGVDYFHIRKYYMSFEGEFVPTREGACFPATIETTTRMFDAICTILTDSEVLQVVLDNSTDPLLKQIMEEYNARQRVQTGV